MADAAIGHAEAHAAAHGHEHPPHLHHHWETPAQQFDASKLGMWLFLATEVLFFAGLFCAYSIYRRTHPEIFLVGQHFLDVKWGMLNTIILILSSFTMALGVWAAQTSRRGTLIVCLILTLAGAAGFMVIKGIEYSDKIAHGKVWGASFHPVHPGDHGEDHGSAGPAAAGHSAAATDAHGAGAATPVHSAPAAGHAASAPATAAAGHDPAAPAAGAPAGHEPPSTPAGHAPSAPASGELKIEVSQIAPPAIAPTGTDIHTLEARDAGGHHGIDPYESAKHMRDLQIFMAIYFCMTGLHGIHVLAGMVVISWLIYGAVKGRYNSQYYTPVDLGGLYWHLVDLVWIYLFPLLYLIH